MWVTMAAYRGTCLAAGAAVLMTISPVQAQQDPPAPPAIKNPSAAEGPTLGRPETAGAQALAPAASPPLATPADKLPIDKIKLPEGFKVEV